MPEAETLLVDAVKQMSVQDAKNILAGGAGAGARFGLIKKDQAKLEQYVTPKALDGLYLMMAEEEKAIRKDPLTASTGLIRKVFGALAK